MGQVLVGMVLGALPGLVLVLVAQYLVEGEVQLTVGVAGIWLAVVGGVVGLVLALRRRGRG
jgi:hypothetical protein